MGIGEWTEWSEYDPDSTCDQLHAAKSVFASSVISDYEEKMMMRRRRREIEEKLDNLMLGMSLKICCFISIFVFLLNSLNAVNDQIVVPPTNCNVDYVLRFMI